MFSVFIRYIEEHEDWLMGRILSYARERDYTRYTSTLKEAWRLSISGLSESLVKTVTEKGADLELGPEEEYTRDPAARFGIIEAQRHRERGITLAMFLGLMKYYRQSYRDLLRESDFSDGEKRSYRNMINRFFDRVEIGFIETWTASEQNQLMEELRAQNRSMTNEKNKYLTIFESLSLPVFLVDKAGRIENMNHVASGFFEKNPVPGATYYEDRGGELCFTAVFPWLADQYKVFVDSGESKAFFEKAIEEEKRCFSIALSRSLDVSGKYAGIVVIMEDCTERKEMEQEMERLATTDPLTGTRNRRSFLQLFSQELARSARYQHPLALLMIDIDHFKKINDAFGHDAGDRVLQLLVETALKLLRSSDTFCRWGGEEFIACLPETDLVQAEMVAERLREKLSAASLPNDSGNPIHFTVSIGLAVMNNGEELPEVLIKKADQALYEAKKQGRNRVVLQ